MSEKLKSLLSRWDLGENMVIKEEAISYETNREPHIWTINEDYILKMTQSKDEMKNNIYFSNLLHQAGVPAQQIVCTLDQASYVKVDDQYYGLFTKIKGEVLKNYYEGDYLGRGDYLGQCIATLHVGLKTITEELKENHNVFDNQMSEELSGWVDEEMNKYLPTCQLSNKEIQVFHEIRNEFNQNFFALYTKLPRQLIHRDVHGENMIFNEEKLVGYIDFDLSQMNARLFDICYLGTGSLASIFNNTEEREKWLPFFKSVVNGYDHESPLTHDEKQSLKYMLYAIEFIMVAFFAKDGYNDIADTNIKMINYINDVWES